MCGIILLLMDTNDLMNSPMGVAHIKFKLQHMNDPSSKICTFHLLYFLNVLYGVWVLCETLGMQPTYMIIETYFKITFISSNLPSLQPPFF